jgi:GNAT superfamily N-acetyltransferase
MAKADEAPALTDLCLRSKAAWGYDREFVEACRHELTLSPADIVSTRIQVAEIDGRIAGVVQIRPRGALAELAKLFVEPTALRSGVGRRLFEWATATAAAGGAAMQCS